MDKPPNYPHLENMDNLEAEATVGFDMHMTSSSNRVALVVAAKRRAAFDLSAMRFATTFGQTPPFVFNPALAVAAAVTYPATA